jgi:TPR repeat protein
VRKRRTGATLLLNGRVLVAGSRHQHLCRTCRGRESDLPSVDRNVRFVICLSAVFLLVEAVFGAQDGYLPPGRMAEIEKRADKGYSNEQLVLADAYITGKGVSQDYSKAAYWFEKAAQNGIPIAEQQIGYLYSVGLGVSRDPVRALHWYQLAAASGVVTAKLNMGVIYLEGMGVDRDVARAKELFQQAAEKGLGMGAAYLGVLEIAGVGGAPDRSAAQKWFELGVKLHDPVSEYALAISYLGNDVDSRDMHKIAGLLRHSSEKGYVEAKYALACILLKQPQLARTDKEPALLLEQASDAGEWRATVALGEIALRPRSAGPAPNPARAFYYFQLAKLQGCDPEQKILRENIQLAEKTLSPEELNREAGQAEAWVAKHHLPLIFVPRSDDTVPAVQDLSASILGAPAVASTQ